MMFSLAVVLGCDLFDSAAYALYARDGRYMTTAGTIRLDDLETISCVCPVCIDMSANRLISMPADERNVRLARHNLYVSFAELARIKQAIAEGRLLELLDRRARSHPALLAAYRRLLDHETFLMQHDPAVKGSFLYVSTECSRRPEVWRHHRTLRAWTLHGEILLAPEDADVEGSFDHRWIVRPPFGPVPAGLEHTYPLNPEVPEVLDTAAFESAALGVCSLARGSPEATITLAHHDWPPSALAQLPANLQIESLDGQSVR